MEPDSLLDNELDGIDLEGRAEKVYYTYSVPTTSRWFKIKLFSMGFMSSLCMLVLERYYEEWAWLAPRTCGVR
jgi:hypothetical protein